MLRLICILTMLVQVYPVISNQSKPIVIITQDGEVDDKSSFVRLLLYTADIDLRGIVATNSVWQKNGHGVDWIHEAIDLYGQVRSNLVLHKSGYPSVEYLQSITVLGNEDPKYLEGNAPYIDSEGADLIIKELLEETSKPLHVNCWGGANTVAHALWKLKTSYPKEEFERAVSRIRIYCISFQDHGGKWIKNNIPEAMIIEAFSWYQSWNYHNKAPLVHNPYPTYMSDKWINEHVKVNHGTLGAWYPQKNVSEGDTPAFLNFIDNGLEAWKDYSYGGWGGRFDPANGNFWKDAWDDGNDKKPLWRWCPDTQNDFAARMDWCVKSYKEANHPPVIESMQIKKKVKPGEKINLTAAASDPDKDQVYYWWWHYKDATNMEESIKIVKESSNNAHFVVPADQTKDIQIILEVTDNGTPSLKRYHRLIFQIEN